MSLVTSRLTSPLGIINMGRASHRLPTGFSQTNEGFHLAFPGNDSAMRGSCQVSMVNKDDWNNPALARFYAFAAMCV